jgi:GNAT superfamily N-acetyltransferase
MSISPYHTAGRADQHRQALLEHADAQRLARLARTRHSHRAPRPGALEATRQWLTAAAVRIRPIRAGDDARLAEVFDGLSAQSRRYRFMHVKKQLTAGELSYLTDVDHSDHEALVALNRNDGSGLGVARYIRDRDHEQMAEIAVTVIDEWQFRGVGTRLVTRLTERARVEGVTQFSALVLADNVAAHRLIKRVPGVATLVDRDEDQLSYLIDLAGARRG